MEVSVLPLATEPACAGDPAFCYNNLTFLTVLSVQFLNEGGKTKHDEALQFYILHDLCLKALEEVAWVFRDKCEVHTTWKSPFQKKSKCTDLHPLSLGSKARVELAFVFLLK